jgi:hypothetical protein
VGLNNHRLKIWACAIVSCDLCYTCCNSLTRMTGGK